MAKPTIKWNGRGKRRSLTVTFCGVEFTFAPNGGDEVWIKTSEGFFRLVASSGNVILDEYTRFPGPYTFQNRTWDCAENGVSFDRERT